MLYSINIERILMMYHNKIDVGSKLRGIRDPFVQLHQLEQ